MTLQNPIVSTEWLAEHLNEPGVRVIEVWNTVDGVHADTPRVPGAVRFFWKSLCWHPTDREFVAPAELARRFGSVGISHEHTVVLVGEPVQYGTYAYWALTMAGHKDTRILDGSRAKWLAEGRPTTLRKSTRDPVTYQPQAADQSSCLGRDNVLANLSKPDRLLIDARTPEEYSGERVIEYGGFDHGAERGGRIPGARHLYFRKLLNDDHTFRTREEIRAALAETGFDPAVHKEIVCYCRLSHRASLVWTALTQIAGFGNVRIYDGSWTEWGSIVGVPIENPDYGTGQHVD